MIVIRLLFQSRPLTRYLPNTRADFDLRTHLESQGHDLEGGGGTGSEVRVDKTCCCGYLLKKSITNTRDSFGSDSMGLGNGVGMGFRGWKRRWFVLDRKTRQLMYFKVNSNKQKTTNKADLTPNLPNFPTTSAVLDTRNFVPFTSLKEVNDVFRCSIWIVTWLSFERVS